MPRISVIMPTFNEAGIIEDALRSLPPDSRLECIVVDGGSTDDTGVRARSLADRLLITKAGRARQMNAGADAAKGEILLFLHADTRLPGGAPEAVIRALEKPEVVGGAFRMAIDSRRRILRWISAAANLRARLTRVPYGDQGIFVRKSVFERLGGFPDLPILEDLEFSRRLKRAGRTVLLPGAVRTDPRRWEREGVLHVTLRNRLFVLLYFLGVSPARLARRYGPIR
jgi:rSAM/selenodomain-associated transferase 2